MILAMLLCLKHRIRFELYSDHTHFALRDGWNDFFQPFGSVNTQRINKDYNLRPYIIDISTERKLQKTIKYHYITGLYKVFSKVDYLTQDLWSFHRDVNFAQATFTVPELGWQDQPLLAATQQFIGSLWKYNFASQEIVNHHIATIPLPPDYISLHVRAGDKFTETGMFDFSEYMVPAERFSANKQAFVFTDDYTVVEQLQAQYPAWHFTTLCAPTERGYFHRDFVKQDKQFKYQQHLKLFANLDICARSSKFIGTYSSNPGMYMGMRIGQERCFCLDFDKWLIW